MLIVGGRPEAERELVTGHKVEDEEDEELSLSSDSEICDALDYLDSKYDEEVDGAFSIPSRRPNAHGGIHASPLQPLSNRMQREWEGRIGVGMSNSVTTAIRASVRDMAIGKAKTIDKADRATVEQTIDSRTRMILNKMDNRGEYSNINGCISTGKEANVYHATKSDGQELAIKKYKTSVLVFKDRDRYMQGNYRFRHRYCRRNPRKMVPKWAEKEMRNLITGIPCPQTHLLRDNVLVMDFVGKGGWAAPRLKDAALSLDKLRQCYREMVIIMRALYQKCKLVHGDLSEYNILYYVGQLYIIDVSQSVDLSHPHALDFLREDSIHVSDFFRKRGVGVMTVRELFDFIVDPCIDDDDDDSVDRYLKAVQQKIIARGTEISAEGENADSVDTPMWSIPNTLDDMKNAEEDVKRPRSGQDTGEKHDGTLVGDPHADLTGNYCHLESSEEEEEVDCCASLLGEAKTAVDKKAARKENKKKVKQEKRVVRETKVPKAMRKKKKKLAKAKKYR
ncbi:hypothetical protein OROHE_024949 [Orobanche hederae]